MANAGVGKYKGKPTIAVEQAVGGAGAKPQAAAAMNAPPKNGGRKEADARNVVRQSKNSKAAPDHRVPVVHQQAGKGGRYTEASR